MAQAGNTAAGALPTGGQVQAGSAAIGAPSGSSLTVTQSSQRAIIDWTSFSIGSGASVQFDNGSGATLNRVTGLSNSTIDGLLGGTGSIYLINPNGVIIGKSGVVKVGGTFVASTLDLSDSQFMGGGSLTFSGAGTAAVINYGKIGALGGDVALIASRVENDGQISALNGDVGLAAGYQVVLRDSALSGGKFSVLVGGSGTSATNAGVIQAADAELRANGGNVYALAGNTGGIIEATGVSTGGGRVFLVAEGGTLSVAGAITARGAGGSGGLIETSGATVDIGKATIDAGHGGSWLIDPYDLTVDATAAATIDTTLGLGTNVALETTASGASGPGIQNASGNGDIFIDSPIAWSTSATLSLSAWRNIDINADITASGAGALSLTTNTGLGGGDYVIAPGRSISFTGGSGSGASLSVNGVPYTLLYSMADVQNVNAGDAALQGHYALATSLDASSTSGWTSIGTDGLGNAANSGAGFSGVFAGLGHTIDDLTISSSAGDTGLFGWSSGAIRDIGMLGGSVSAPGGESVGGLVGNLDSGGSVSNAYTTGSVSGYRSVGGLVGYQSAGSTIANAYATGAVMGSDYDVGGLVGWQDGGTISNAHATGNVSGGWLAGGLVGYSHDGVISYAYATGDVTVGGANFVGGLVGEDYGGTISNVYATGAVSGYGSVGGLIGFNNNVALSNAYATGSVSGGYAVGGLVGQAYSGGSITNVYSTGAVSASSDHWGGLIGYNESATITGAYWDTQTSGQPTSAGGVGLTTAQFFDASNFTGFSFGTTPGAPGWVIVDGDGSLNNAGGAAGGARPMLLSEYSTNISNVHQLQLMALDLSATYTLAANIDASATGDANPSGLWTSAGFVPIGNAATPFAGLFDGQGHTIGGLVINRPSTDDVGLFGWSSGVIRDIGMVGGSVSAPGGESVGGLVGYLDSGGSVSNAYTTGSVSGYRIVGGLVGYQNDNSTISNAYASGAVTGSDYYVGGLVGWQHGGTISNAYATGNVSGGWQAGGLVGYSSGVISYAYATGDVTVGGANYVGGLVGVDYGGTISNAYATGNVSGGGAVGGLTGYDYNAAVTDSYATGAASGIYSVGGLVGEDYGGTISNAYATGDVSGYTTSMGGLVGHVTGTAISNAYATGDVSGGTYVGGLVGYDEAGTISNAYATGAVSGSGKVGGLTGNNSGGWITDAYATGAVSGASQVGGLTGDNSGGVIANAYAAGAVTGSYSVGGLVGRNIGAITNAYATGAVSGAGQVGGLVGYNMGGSITNAYAAGAVSGGSNVGGLVGLSAGTITNSYWDTQTSGQSGSAGGVGLTTAQMQDPASYAASGWDFVNVWSPPSAGYYPELYGVSHVLRISADDLTKVYGDNVPTLTSSIYGLQGGDTAAIVTGGALSTSATNTTWVGNYAIDVGAASATGSSGAYRIIYQDGTLSITPRPLTVTLKGTVPKVYDSTTSATLGGKNYQLSGVLFSDAVSLAYPTSGTYDTKNAGSGKTVTVNGLTLKGPAAVNYTVNAQASAPIGKITPAKITVSLVGTVSKRFDATNIAYLSPSNYATSGVYAGDVVVIFDPLTGTYNNAKVGTGKKVTVNGIAITGGADAGNYTINSSATANNGVITH